MTSASQSAFTFTPQEQFTHIITTDNVYFNNIGLGSFTTGILYEYFNARGNDGEYINRSVIKKSQEEEISNFADLFGAPPAASDREWGGWLGWKRITGQPAGYYEPQTYKDWTFQTENNGIRRDNDFDLEFFAPTQISDPSDTENEEEQRTGQVPNLSVLNEDSVGKTYSIISPHPTMYNGLEINIFDGLTAANRYLEDTKFLVEEDCPIIDLIVMNEFMIDLGGKATPDDWDEFDGDGEETLGDDELDSILPMLQEIRISKYRTVAFSGELTFELNLAGGQIKCPVTEWVSFELRLYNQAMTNLGKPTAVPKSNYIADVKTDAFGRQGSKEDGEITLSDGTKTLAGWNTSYNEYLNKFETGTKQVLGKCMQDIPAAASPSIDVLIATDIAQMLGSKTTTNKFIPGTGYCMPIFMQNGNPLQWSPNYASTKDCRGSDRIKQQVRGFNFARNRSFKKDDMVNLNQIDGVWHVSPLDKSDDAVTAGVAREWTFQYFLATKDLFFKGRGPDTQLVDVTPFDAERIAHKSYYQGDSKQVDIIYNDQFSTLGLGEIEGFIKTDSSWQVSSFDFMDAQIFGSREDGNAIGTTNAKIDAAGRDIPLVGDQIDRNAAHSGPFFGCVFPNGYEGTAKNEVIDPDARGWQFKVSFSGGKRVSGDGRRELIAPFSVSDEYKNTNPFSDEYIVPDVTPNRLPPQSVEPVALRHDLCSATKKDFYLQSSLSEAENQWYWPWFRDGETNYPGQPGTFQVAYFGPDMFYEYNKVGLLDFKQVPADIATLGDPNSQWGQPWYATQRCKLIYKHSFEDTNYEAHRGNLGVKKQIKDIFESAAWIGKEDPDDEEAKINDKSAFGFEPVNKNKIQFRPLKMEAYLAYNDWHSQVLKGGTSDIVPYGLGDVDPHDPFGEGYFLPVMDFDRQVQWLNTFANGDNELADARSLGDYPYKSWRNHMCRFFRSRGPMVNMDQIKYREEVNNYGALTSMWRVDSQAPEGDLGVLIPGGQLKIGSVDIESASDQRGRMFFNARGEPTSYWEFGNSDYIGVQGWQEFYLWKGEPEDSIVDPAVRGVIGAQCTIGARSTIQFKTDNNFGMSSARNPSGDDFNEDPSWGGRDGYKGSNTYCLSATIYQQHPRSQTIYDPEYFCVHHFNPGPWVEGRYCEYKVSAGGGQPENYFDLWDEPYDEDSALEWPFYKKEDYNIEAGFDLPSEEDGVEEEVCRQVVSKGKLYVYQEEFGVELRIPTHQRYSTINTDYGPLNPAGVGLRTFADRTKSIAGEEFEGILLPKDQWLLNVTRVGKMLPYRYFTRVFSIDTNNWLDVTDSRIFDLTTGEGVVDWSTYFDNYDEDQVKEEKVTNLIGKFIHSDRGQDFLPGDKVGNAFYGIEFEVVEVEEIDGIPGVIKALKYLGPIDEDFAFEIGEDWVGDFTEIDHEILPNYCDVLDPNDAVGLKFFDTIESENGRNFEAWMVNLTCRKKAAIDQKPLYIAREQQISSKSLKTTSGDEEYGFIAEELDTTFTIPDDQKAENNEYDIFFHCQNDPQFVWNTTGGGDEGGAFFSPGFSTQIYYFGNNLNTNEMGEQFIDCDIFTS